MSDAKVLSPQWRQAGFYGFLLTSIVAACFSLKHAVNPASVYSPKIKAEIDTALREGRQYQAPLNVTRSKAYSLLLGGVAVVSGLSAIAISSARPSTLTTQKLERAHNPLTPDTLDDLDDQTHEDQGQIVLDKLTDVFIEYPWLDEVVDIEGSLMDLLIIIGEPGKGKSSLASSIGMLRQIVHRAPLFQFDPDADRNVQNQVWVSGEVVGMTPDVHQEIAGDWADLPFKQQFERAREVMIGQLKRSEEPSITAVYDELIRYKQEGFSSEEVEQFYKEYTAYRKRGDKVIWLWHDATKAGSGLDHLPKESALLTTLLRYAAVIDFNAAPTDKAAQKRIRRSKEKNSDTALYKPPGQPYATANMELIVIPKLLNPSTLLGLLGSAASYFDVRLSGHRDPGLAERRRSIRKRINTKLKGLEPDSSGNFKSSLESIFQSKITRHQLLTPSPDKGEIEDGFDLDGLPSQALFVALLTYLEYPQRKRTANAEGFFSIRKIQDNWGKKKAGGKLRFSSTDALRAFLDVYCSAGLSQWGDEKQHRWKPLVEAAEFEENRGDTGSPSE